MLNTKTRTIQLFATGITLVLLSGCGSSENAPTSTDNGTGDTEVKTTAETTSHSLPTASIAPATTQTASATDAAPPAEDSPAAKEAELVDAHALKSAPELIKEIEFLQAQPLQGKGQKIDPQKIAVVLKQRNQDIVNLASTAILKAVQNKDADQVLLKAVTFLSEARLQLALQGDEENAQLLFSDATFLQEKYPGSEAAMQAAYASVRFTHNNAKLLAGQDPQWVTAFARHAQLFAQNFPEKEQKTLPLLLAAGNSCDAYGLTEEAQICFNQILQQYPETEVAKNSQGILRRLSLPGKPLKFGGTTFGGEFLKIDKYHGKVTVIAFWSTSMPNTQKYLTEVDRICKQTGAATIGVTLNEDELAVEQTVGETGIGWQQIFSSNPEKRRWETPVVKYYGVRKIPSLWIMKADGTVLTCTAKLDTLEETLTQELNQ